MDEGTTFQGARRYFSLSGLRPDAGLVMARTTPSDLAFLTIVGCRRWVSELLDHEFKLWSEPERGRIVGRVLKRGRRGVDRETGRRAVLVRRFMNGDYSLRLGRMYLNTYSPEVFELMSGLKVPLGATVRVIFDFKRC